MNWYFQFGILYSSNTEQLSFSVLCGANDVFAQNYLSKLTKIPKGASQS